MNVKSALVLVFAIGTLLSTISSAEAARRPRGPVIIVTSPQPIVSHS